MRISRISRIVVVAFVLMCGYGFSALGCPKGTEADSLATQMLSAIEKNDYALFVKKGTAEMTAAMTKELFAKVRIQMVTRMKKGYSTAFLGELNQQGSKVHIWKMTCKDGGDDILVKLVLKDHAVAGFWLQ